MISVANRIYVKQEYADAFEQRFRDRAGLVDKMSGFISNHVLRPVNEGDPYVVFTSEQSSGLSQLGDPMSLLRTRAVGHKPKAHFLRQTF